MTAPLMPKATAVWLVENTTLTFRQISVFCELHELEVQAIADGDVAYNIVGISPITSGQLALEEIKRCEADPRTNLEASSRLLCVPVSSQATPRPFCSTCKDPLFKNVRFK